MSFKERISNFFDRIRKRHKLIFINDTTYKEKWSFNVSVLNLMSLLALYTLVILIALLLLIKYTPLKAVFVGGNIYDSKHLIDENTSSIDSLYKTTRANQLYIDNLQRILHDEPLVDTEMTFVDTFGSYVPDFTKAESDSILREKIENRYNGSSNFTSSENYSFFFSPVNGIISRSFDRGKKHFGIDVVTLKDEPIKACLEGTIIFTGWTPSDGNVVIIQHTEELLSIYKHCSELLKMLGEFVQTGDPIAIVGNTGENSSGPHLHFELWKKGNPIDPNAFISFQE